MDNGYLVMTMTELTNNGKWVIATPTEDDIVVTLYTDEWEHNSALKDIYIGDKLKCKNRVIVRFVDRLRPNFIVSEIVQHHATTQEIKRGLRNLGFKNVR